MGRPSIKFRYQVFSGKDYLCTIDSSEKVVEIPKGMDERYKNACQYLIDQGDTAGRLFLYPVGKSKVKDRMHLPLP